MDKVQFLYRSQHVVQHALDLLFPPACAICKRSGSVLCSSCMASIPLLQPPFCLSCSSIHIVNGICQSCRYRPLQMSGLRAASVYQGALRSCVHALKYEGNTRLAEPLGNLLAYTYRKCNMHADIIIPVPLHSERQRKRGYNQSTLLAEVCARQLGLPFRHDVVVRTRDTQAQVGLSSFERQQNVAHAFACSPLFATSALSKRTIIIIDDVCTTGATMEACAASLFAAGVQSVWGLVLARPV